MGCSKKSIKIQKMNVFILTEGSKNIGFGHVTRCTSLYDAFEEKNISPTFIINSDDAVIPLIGNKRYAIFNWLEERDKLFFRLKNADIVILDSYLADITFYGRISETVKIPVYIDDTLRIDYPRGIVVNGTIFAEDLGYPPKENMTYLLGSRYIPLRKEFWEVPEKSIRETIETVMVTFGGDDMRNLTPKIMKMLNKNFPELIEKVITGRAFKNIEQIEILKNAKTELIYYPDAEGMKKAMLESDIAISAGGQTLYELARVGVPTIAISIAENQMNNVKGWQKAGFIEYAGWWEERNVLKNINKKINILKESNIREEKKKIGKRMVDGLGAVRIVQAITNLI
jgi:UDP-2,4-diacetamido-2,4,6-trideoxy-beta-L-altropyranose hydrolase